MAKNNQNVFSPSIYAVFTAPLGTALPTTPTLTPGAGYLELGYASDAGIGEGRGVNENKIFDLVGALVRITRNQEERTFTVTALEDNRVVRELKYPGSTLTSTAGTAEVQTVTLTGTGTAGTWSLTLPGYGTAASGLAYNITTTALQAALIAAFGISGITVTGTAGSSYVVTFPASVGNVPQMNATNSITGVTSITVATTTPGVNGVNTRAIGSGTGQNLRVFYFVAFDGTKGQAFAISQGEAVATGDTTLSVAGKTTQFTVTAYQDSSGNFVYLIDNDGAQAVTYA